ncbi:MAG TPA: hypothetical protein VL069_04040 [Opitutus sp.]|nr:hypothetical protein [Opitutus sp.]
MPEVSVSSLDVRQQRLAENAKRALEQGDFDYVIESSAEILKRTPGCCLVRRMQRSAQLEKFKTRNRVDRVIRSARAWVRFVLRIRRNPAADSLAHAEHVLACDPGNVSALRLLGESAQALGMLETALFAFKAFQEIRPGHRENQLSVGAALLALNRPAEALRIAEALLTSEPADFEAQWLQRKASVDQTITRGNWEAGSPFGDRLGNPQ